MSLPRSATLERRWRHLVLAVATILLVEATSYMADAFFIKNLLSLRDITSTTNDENNNNNNDIFFKTSDVDQIRYRNQPAQLPQIIISAAPSSAFMTPAAYLINPNSNPIIATPTSSSSSGSSNNNYNINSSDDNNINNNSVGTKLGGGGSSSSSSTGTSSNPILHVNLDLSYALTDTGDGGESNDTAVNGSQSEAPVASHVTRNRNRIRMIEMATYLDRQRCFPRLVCEAEFYNENINTAPNTVEKLVLQRYGVDSSENRFREAALLGRGARNNATADPCANLSSTCKQSLVLRLRGRRNDTANRAI